MRKKFNFCDLILAAVTILCALGALWYHDQYPVNVSLYNTSSLSYAKAKVMEVIEEEAKEDANVKGRYYGIQTLSAEILGGSYQGKEVIIDNYLSATHNIRLGTGDLFIACIDQPESANSLITVYNYYRTPYIYFFCGLLIAFVALIGKSKGIRTVISLIFCLYCIITFLLPMIFNGLPPVLLTILLIILMIGYSLFMLNGYSLKTWTAIIATVLGVIFSGLIFYAMSFFIHISGFQTDQAEALILISQQTGLKINEILFSGVLISCLGAVTDVGLSLASALYEVKSANPRCSRQALFKAGINIGKDMIGTMCNTLILAFTGSSLTMLIAFYAYQIQYHQLMNSDYIAVEIAQGLAGTFGVVLTVPLGALAGSLIYTAFWQHSE